MKEPSWKCNDFQDLSTALCTVKVDILPICYNGSTDQVAGLFLRIGMWREYVRKTNRLCQVLIIKTTTMISQISKNIVVPSRVKAFG